MTVIVSALVGVIMGPVLHTLAVQAGADRPFRPLPWACPRCDRTSYRARCGCGRLRGRELLTSALAAAGMALMAAAIDSPGVLVAHQLMVAVTTILVVTDFDHLRIPNRILYPGTVVSVGALGAVSVFSGRSADIGRGVVGGGVYLVLFLLVYLAARGQGFGFGDVKLAFLLGAFATFHSWLVLARSLFVTALLGGIPALILLARGRSRTSYLPYGPPLIIGTWIAIALFA